jgi:hypothetical protein
MLLTSYVLASHSCSSRRHVCYMTKGSVCFRPLRIWPLIGADICRCESMRVAGSPLPEKLNCMSRKECADVKRVS